MLVTSPTRTPENGDRYRFRSESAVVVTLLRRRLKRCLDEHFEPCIVGLIRLVHLLQVLLESGATCGDMVTFGSNGARKCVFRLTHSFLAHGLFGLAKDAGLLIDLRGRGCAPLRFGFLQWGQLLIRHGTQTVQGPRSKLPIRGALAASAED
jgi:hypothetical protein